MVWENESNKYTNSPVVVLELYLDTGTMYLCTKDLEVSGVGLYEGRVLIFGVIHMTVSDTDARFEISDVSTVLSNTDKRFTNEDLQRMMNRRAVYKVGYPSTSWGILKEDGGSLLTESDDPFIQESFVENEDSFKTVFVGTISDFSFQDYQFSITVTDATKLWLEKEYGHTVDSTDWPNTSGGVGGMKMPIIYGELSGTI